MKLYYYVIRTKQGGKSIPRFPKMTLLYSQIGRETGKSSTENSREPAGIVYKLSFFPLRLFSIGRYRKWKEGIVVNTGELYRQRVNTHIREVAAGVVVSCREGWERRRAGKNGSGMGEGILTAFSKI